MALPIGTRVCTELKSRSLPFPFCHGERERESRPLLDAKGLSPPAIDTATFCLCVLAIGLRSLSTHGIAGSTGFSFFLAFKFFNFVNRNIMNFPFLTRWVSQRLIAALLSFQNIWFKNRNLVDPLQPSERVLCSSMFQKSSIMLRGMMWCKGSLTRLAQSRVYSPRVGVKSDVVRTFMS